MQRISLLAAVSDASFGEELRSQLAQQNDIELIGEAHDGDGVIRAVRDLQPDVLLLDGGISSGGSHNAESPLLEAVHRISPRTKTILLSDTCTERAVTRAFLQGARGCTSAGALGEDIVRAIQAVNAGELWISRKALAAVIDDLLSRLQRTDYVSSKWSNLLSDREQEVADGVRLGLTNKEIARKLGISDTTVKTHLENIFQKLNVSRRVQLAILAREVAARRRAAAYRGPERRASGDD